MSRAVIIMIGLLALALLISVCINNNATVIQADIEARATDVLSTDSTDWAVVRIDGRNIILTGVAPTEALRQKAITVASEVTGVVKVENQMTVADSISAESTVSLPNSVTENTAFKNKFIKNASGIMLTGSVPDLEQQQKLMLLAEQEFGSGNVTNHLSTGLGMSEDWYKTADIALKNLALLKEGTIEITDNQVTITGQVIDDEVKQTIVSNFKKELPEDIISHFNLSEARVELVENQQVIRDPNKLKLPLSCEEKFNQVVTTQTIFFSSNSADIESQANKILDTLLKFANVCPKSIIEVAGHTDSRGNAASNYLLSKQRALAVANSLIKNGIAVDRLAVEGYGETRPVSDNDTEKGRANNRRIQVKYLREGE